MSEKLKGPSGPFSFKRKTEEFIKQRQILFNKILKNTICKNHDSIDIPNVKYKTAASFAEFIESYRDSNVPIVLRNAKLIDENVFSAHFAQLLDKKIDLIDLDSYRGFANSAVASVQLSDHVNHFDNNYAAVKDAHDLYGRELWRYMIPPDFFLGCDNIWVFWNVKGLRVPLHYDSMNNIHAVLSGSKTFCLLPPDQKGPLVSEILSMKKVLMALMFLMMLSDQRTQVPL